jgi:hypothetical protein
LCATEIDRLIVPKDAEIALEIDLGTKSVKSAKPCQCPLLAAEIFGISDRHMRRWRERHVEEGLEVE